MTFDKIPPKRGGGGVSVCPPPPPAPLCTRQYGGTLMAWRDARRPVISCETDRDTQMGGGGRGAPISCSYCRHITCYAGVSRASYK